jgi:hypothetical protein
MCNFLARVAAESDIRRAQGTVLTRVRLCTLGLAQSLFLVPHYSNHIFIYLLHPAARLFRSGYLLGIYAKS